MAKAQVQAEFTANTAGFKRGVKEMDSEVSKFRASINSAMRTSLAAVGGTVAAGATAVMTKMVKDGMAQAFSMEQNKVVMSSMLGDIGKASQAMAMLTKETLENPMFSKQDMAEAGRALANDADGSVVKLKSLVETAQKLSVLNPPEGIRGAAFSLKEALSGDYVSLAERFNVSKSQIRGLKDQGLNGQQIVDAILKDANITQGTLNNLSMTMQGQIQTLNNTMANVGEEFVNSFWPKLQPQLAEVQGWMQANKDEIIAGMSTVANGVMTALKAAGVLGSWFDKATSWAGDKMFNNIYEGKGAMQSKFAGITAGGLQYALAGGGYDAAMAEAAHVEARTRGAQLGSRAIEIKNTWNAPSSGQVPTGMQHT